MRLTHFSEEPFKFDPTRTYEQHSSTDKPTGLWLSDEYSYGWKKWCVSEEFNVSGLRYSTELEVDTDKILIISNLAGIIDFTHEYERRPSWASGRVGVKYIDWKTVSQEYSGIVITPYVNEARHRFDSHWYYGWDCASGCIWDLSAVKEIV